MSDLLAASKYLLMPNPTISRCATGQFALAADCANPNQFLNSQELTQYISRRTTNNFLSLGLNNPNQLVRAISLKGLSSILMHPKKVRGGAAHSYARKTSGRRRHLRRASTAGPAGRGGRGRQVRQGRRGWECLGNPAVPHRAGGASGGWDSGLPT